MGFTNQLLTRGADFVATDQNPRSSKHHNSSDLWLFLPPKEWYVNVGQVLTHPHIKIVEDNIVAIILIWGLAMAYIDHIHYLFLILTEFSSVYRTEQNRPGNARTSRAQREIQQMTSIHHISLARKNNVINHLFGNGNRNGIIVLPTLHVITVITDIHTYIYI